MRADKAIALKIVALFMVYLISTAMCKAETDEGLINMYVDPGVPKQTTCNFHKVCIEGHVYYHWNCIDEFTLTPKLSDSGKPVKCKGKKWVCKEVGFLGCN